MFKPKDIYTKIGMSADRFRYFVKQDVFTPDNPSSRQGSSCSFSDKTALLIGIFHLFEATGFSVNQCQELTNKILASKFSAENISISTRGTSWHGLPWMGPGGGVVSVNAADVVTEAMIRLGITKEQVESWK